MCVDNGKEIIRQLGLKVSFSKPKVLIELQQRKILGGWLAAPRGVRVSWGGIRPAVRGGPWARL